MILKQIEKGRNGETGQQTRASWVDRGWLPGPLPPLPQKETIQHHVGVSTKAALPSIPYTVSEQNQHARPAVTTEHHHPRSKRSGAVEQRWSVREHQGHGWRARTAAATEFIASYLSSWLSRTNMLFFYQFRYWIDFQMVMSLLFYSCVISSGLF